MTIASRAPHHPRPDRRLALAFAAQRAEACSICRCGDATFNALGKDVTSEPGFRFAFDIDRFSKTQGPPDEQDSIVEERYTAVGAYTLGSRALLVARVPFAQRTLDERVGDDVEHSEASGLGDPELSAQIRLWSSPLNGDLGRRLSFSATAGVKTNWGQNDIEGTASGSTSTCSPAPARRILSSASRATTCSTPSRPCSRRRSGACRAQTISAISTATSRW